MNNPTTISQWLDTAVSGIRFAPDRKTVRAELQAHIEDKTADLERIFPGIPPGEARERALAGMGDPEEVKAELARVHKPWLGYLWKVSRVLAALLLVVTLFQYGTGALETWIDYRNMVNRLETTAQQLNQDSYATECYQSGIDPWRANGPYPAEHDGITRTPLAALRPEGRVWSGGYRFRMERAGLFHFQNGEADPGDWWLFGELRALGLPWAPADVAVPRRLRGVDSAGNQYASSYEVYELGLEHEGYVMVNGGGSVGLEQCFDVEIIGIAPGAEWIRLEYDHMGVQWSLTIPLETEGGGTNG